MSCKNNSDNDNSSKTVEGLTLVDGAYKNTNLTAEETCLDYLSKTSNDAKFWVDPDGTGPSAAFTVDCDMKNGGYTVFKKEFSHANTTDTTVTFFDTNEIQKLNAIRALSTQISITSDLSITFNSDISANACNGSPLIPANNMDAKTLKTSSFTDNSITTRNFSGSSDRETLNFDNSTNQFTAVIGKDCSMASNFGVNETVLLISLKLKTISSDRAFSKLSGTYYTVKLK